MLETLTDEDLIKELAHRHDRLIVIRPKRTNRADDVDLLVFCKTFTEDGTYDIFEATSMLQDAQSGMLKECLVPE